ncbi:hypothetical protein EJ04DRAFT_544551 [Polyplosphaeria fusca]|uniref:Heterokaryon incompatibility domain-containing protein n=1 Tax=Polyplosphaeria fusca TaxID=682080 RepID=A0A9P4UY21_9PLEO|nr:hypothetical protein EJ04DRAFT_544551 [Polyplosphaeria fusca]
MSNSSDVAWSSLVSRSIAAWDDLISDEQPVPIDLHKNLLREYHSLDEFLVESPKLLTFWFFQRRSAFISQKRFKKWSREDLDDLVLIPASPGYVWRTDCFFVSHFWRSREHPDPDGTTLRLHQAELEPQTWSYIWVDWTCMPQHPRSPSEQKYFSRGLRTMSGIIRNTGFIYFYPPFKPRLWILYEIAEYHLTCVGGIQKTPDIEPFLQHINEMIEKGVLETLAKHHYDCYEDYDRQFLTSWLELLVLFRRLEINIDFIRKIMDHMTWFNVLGDQVYPGLKLNRYEGRLVYLGNELTFTPFPKWEDEPDSLDLMAQCREGMIVL